MSAELGRLLAANRKDRRKAVVAGLTELAKRKALQPNEATELGAIMEMYFEARGGSDAKLTERVQTYFDTLSLDASSSATALAIASVISSLVSRAKASSDQKKIAAVSGGDVLFGGTGTIIGAGIGFGFGGPIGAGIGAVVGAAVGVCIDESG